MAKRESFAFDLFSPITSVDSRVAYDHLRSPIETWSAPLGKAPVGLARDSHTRLS